MILGLFRWSICKKKVGMLYLVLYQSVRESEIRMKRVSVHIHIYVVGKQSPMLESLKSAQILGLIN